MIIYLNFERLFHKCRYVGFQTLSFCHVKRFTSLMEDPLRDGKSAVEGEIVPASAHFGVVH